MLDRETAPCTRLSVFPAKFSSLFDLQLIAPLLLIYLIVCRLGIKIHEPLLVLCTCTRSANVRVVLTAGTPAEPLAHPKHVIKVFEKSMIN